MPADVGTRPNQVTANNIGPNSCWMLGKEWMNMSTEQAIEKGIIKKIEEVKVEGIKKDEFKKGITFDPGFESLNKGHLIVTFSQKQIEKTSEILAASDYIYPPMKRNFRSFVRITSCVLLAVQRFKTLLNQKKIHQ